jgi:hypothetical protein
MHPKIRGRVRPENRGRAHPTSPTGYIGINRQLAQARKLEDKFTEEYRLVRLLRTTIDREVSTRSERVRELGR